jgi:hypothetical protein
LRSDLSLQNFTVILRPDPFGRESVEGLFVKRNISWNWGIRVDQRSFTDSRNEIIDKRNWR